MMIIEETAVPQAVLPLDEFKLHLRLGTGFSDGDIQDPVLESFLRAALSAVEARTGKVLISRNFLWTTSQWRDPSGQVIPLAPVSAVASVVLRDAQGLDKTVSPNTYRLEKHVHRPRLRPIGASLPSVPTHGEVEISLTAGIATEWEGLPADLSHAVLLLAAHFYEYRHETGLSEGCMPFGVSSLIERYRDIRLFAGGGQ